ncbi:NADH-quinone oxidoreductase subunit M [Thermoactinomyces sp. DSM 45891]|uniref:complex I subunit 4 family protein n=1 Tax=Thermoactinomyces sp. DSM 45891 TaxID=1761907 RepID=UPI00091144D6|nr:NADH-quinone oxidoreductase subunit M [Thermoactinomyces sp. DSM 45891]SFX23925.1 NADH-quinone oxidoreductase subunit M [Thermoactinomyces sp. DSM 45891]
MNALQHWLLSFIIFAPLLGLLFLAVVPSAKISWHRMIGLLAMLPSLVLSIYLYQRLGSGASSLQWTQKFEWFHIGDMKLFYHLGVDGLSVIMLLLTAAIALFAGIASLYITTKTKLYYSLLLLLEVGTLGVFASQNLLLFFLFFEMTLVTLFLLISGWGGLEKKKASYMFLLYNGLGSAFLLFAIIGLLAFTSTLELDQIKAVFAQVDLGGLPPEATTFVWGIFLSFMIAFAIKLPVFPFHTWMLKVHVEAPPSVVMIHAGVLLKMGAYGMIRFGVGLFPTLFAQIATGLMILGLIGILYGAVLAFSQKELKSVIAYSSVSHMGILVIGLASLTEAGMQGAIYQAVSHGIISALLFFLITSLVERTRTTELIELGGLAKQLPILSGLFMVGAMGLLGLPGLSGFVSELIAFLGVYQVNPQIAIIGSFGFIIAAAYTLRALLKVTYGQSVTRFQHLQDIQVREWLPMLLLVILSIWMGVDPDWIGNQLQQTIQMGR